jgi:hypothetical protein
MWPLFELKPPLMGMQNKRFFRVILINEFASSVLGKFASPRKSISAVIFICCLSIAGLSMGSSARRKAVTFSQPTESTPSKKPREWTQIKKHVHRYTFFTVKPSIDEES